MDKPPLLSRALVEVIGTFGFFFLGFMGIAVATQLPGSIGSIGIAAGFGLGLGLMIFAFGHVSGGHFNPARSIAPAIVSGQYSNLWIYIVGPLVGGSIAGVLYAWLRRQQRVPAVEGLADAPTDEQRPRSSPRYREARGLPRP